MKVDVLTVLDLIGVFSFAISGALVGVKKNMDYLGVCLLSVITCVGGGVMRDVIIGHTPPVMFSNPVFVFESFAVSSIVFIQLYFHLNVKAKPGLSHVFEEIMFWFDTIGLASFTADGVVMGQGVVVEHALFMSVFVGVITGVGGGVLRDLLAGVVPAIFVKHIYALASIIGALVISLLLRVTGEVTAIAIGMAIIVVIRVLARHYKWNLPRIR